MAAPFDVPCLGRCSLDRPAVRSFTVTLDRILRPRGSRWKGNSHERTPIAGLMGADGVLDGPVGEVGRVRAQAGAGGAQRAVRDGRDGKLAGEQARGALAQVALERSRVVRAVAMDDGLGRP